MATMGVRVNQGSGSASTGLADTLAKALFGDAETEMKLALQRQDYKSEAWRRKVWEAQEANSRAAAANQQAVADTANWELGARQRNVPVVQDYYGGLVEPPAPVEVPDVPIPQPTPRPEMPVPIDLDLSSPNAAAMQLGTAIAAQQAPTTPAVLPDVNAAIMPEATGATAEQLAAEGIEMPVPVDQELPGPTPDIPVTPEQQAAYQREVDARRAEAELIIAGGGTANQMAQGLGVGEGIVKVKSTDPEIRRQGEILYTGKAPEPGAAGKGEMELRKEYVARPEFKRFDIVNSAYKNLLSGAAQNSGFGDNTMIYAWVKMVDPGSTVGAGDTINLRNAPGIAPNVANELNNLLTMQGRKFDEAGIRQFVQAATATYTDERAGIERLNKLFGDLASKSGYLPENVIMPPEDITQPNLLPPGVTEEAVQALMREGISREDAIDTLVLRNTGGR